MRKRSYQAWVKLGPMSDFPAGETRLATYTNPFTVPWDGKTSNVACWVRHMGANQMQVFAVNCAHLGCPVRWFPESRLFMCPCHGGVYYEDGERASGPPPRGLFQYEHEVRGDELWVRGGQMPTLANAV
jgi:Rieske Fe-S protein